VRGRACSKRLDGLSSANDTRAWSGLPWHRRVHFKRMFKPETLQKPTINSRLGQLCRVI
jgi:hypothetical protein